MPERFMLLPASNVENMRLLKIPEDFQDRDALRHATALIASVEENDPDYSWEDIAPVLEDHGFEVVPFMVGPELD